MNRLLCGRRIPWTEVQKDKYYWECFPYSQMSYENSIEHLILKILVYNLVDIVENRITA